MKHARFLLALISMSLFSGMITASAQEDAEYGDTHLQAGSVTHVAYYIAADEAGIQQVFQIVVDGTANESRQVTRAASDVLTYGAAYDGLAVAYTSDGQLWLQPIHTEEPQALAAITTDRIVGRPIFSQDGQYIAYPDSGVWLLDLSTRDSRQLLAGVPLADDASNAGAYRIFSPEQFILGTDGSAAWLVVDIGVWEWNTAGVVDLATGEIQAIDTVLYTDMLPLYGGRALIYGNNALDGEPVLRVAPNVSDLQTFDEVLNFAGLIENVAPFAEQAVEVAPGTVRVMGSVIGPAWDFVGRFYFDYDLMANGTAVVNTLPLPIGETGAVDTGPMSPDGALVPAYIDVTWTEAGSKSGRVVVLDVATGAEVAALEGTVSAFHWQP